MENVDKEEESLEEYNKRQEKLKAEFKQELFNLLDGKYVDLHCADWREVFDELYYNPFLSNGI